MNAPVITTRVAHAGYYEHGFMGAELYRDLLGREPMVGMIARSVTGRGVPEADTPLLDALGVVIAIADPRIWPMKACRLVGAYGGLFPAFAAGYLCLEEARLGPWPFRTAADTLVELAASLPAPYEDQQVLESLRALRRRRELGGFGVPFRLKDERLMALDYFVRLHRRDRGPSWTLFKAVERVAPGAMGLQANVALGGSALLLDLGFAPGEVMPLIAALGTPVFFANAVEAAARPEPALQELPRGSVRYVGAAPRQSPRARRSVAP